MSEIGSQMSDVGAGIATALNNIEDNSTENVEGSNTEPYDYREYNGIKLLHTETEEIEEIPFDEYLCGVVAAEMPASFSQEALKAQAVVARTYTIFKAKNNNGKHGEAIICDSHLCCQEWMSKEERYEKWGDSADKGEYWNKISRSS